MYQRIPSRAVSPFTKLHTLRSQLGRAFSRSKRAFLDLRLAGALRYFGCAYTILLGFPSDGRINTSYFVALNHIYVLDYLHICKELSFKGTRRLHNLQKRQRDKKGMNTLFHAFGYPRGLPKSSCQSQMGHVDVLINCSDLTEESKLERPRQSAQPCEFVTAENHDWTSDAPSSE